MVDGWKTYKLKELCTKIGSGSTPRGGKSAYKKEGISLIRSQNVLDFIFSTNGLAFIDDNQANKLKNVIIESRDVLLNITGDSVARVCQVPDKWIPARVNQHVAIIRANQKRLNPEFLKYLLLSPVYKGRLLTLASAGATRNAITKSMIEDFEINIPDNKVQKAIANILSALDDKIELNLQMNKTLEKMAMALYKHWFVDFGPFQDGKFVDSELGKIPEEWQAVNIGEVVDLKQGLAINKKTKHLLCDENFESAIPLFKIRDLLKNTVEHYVRKDEVPKQCIAEKSDLIFTRTGQVGYVFRWKEGCVHNNCFKVIPNDKIEREYLYQFLINPRIRELANSLASGSVQKDLNHKSFKSILITLPPFHLQAKFKDLVFPMVSKINENIIENKILTKTRDTLLPKLISGEIRVKEAAKLITQHL